MSSDPQTVQEIDDADASVAYTANWAKKGSSNEHNHTTHFTSTPGAYFSLTFTGTSIKVFGTTSLVSQNIRHSYYAIDGSFVRTFFQPKSTITQGDQLFFSADGLPSGTHTLVGTCSGANIWLDYFHIGTASPISSRTVESLPSPTVPKHANFSTATLPHETPTSTVTGASSLSDGDVSAIAGASISGFVFIVVIFVLVWCFRRYRHLSSSPSSLHDADAIIPENLVSEGSSTTSIPASQRSLSIFSPTIHRDSSSPSAANADSSASPTHDHVSGNTNQVLPVRSRSRIKVYSRPNPANTSTSRFPFDRQRNVALRPAQQFSIDDSHQEPLPLYSDHI